MIGKLTVNHRGGEVFDVSQEPSARCVLWGELIKEKERRFLKEGLREELICFCVRDTFQIFIRAVWRPESATCKGMIHRRGRFAILLHDMTGRLTTSWTWLKLVQPLYQMGMSVILVDLPGLGKSSINNVPNLDPSVWQSHSGHILCHLLDELKVSKCHVVACGCSCSTLIQMLIHSPHQLEKEHIFHNPVLDFNEIFKDTIRGPAPGTGPKWRDILRAEQQQELEKFLTSCGVRLFATFDQAEYGRTRETYESFLMARKHMVLSKTLTAVEVTKEDVCEAQIGANVPVRFLFLRKAMRDRYVKALVRSASKATPASSPQAATTSAPGNPQIAATASATAGLRRPSQQGMASAGMGLSRSMGALPSGAAGAASGMPSGWLAASDEGRPAPGSRPGSGTRAPPTVLGHRGEEPPRAGQPRRGEAWGGGPQHPGDSPKAQDGAGEPARGSHAALSSGSSWAVKTGGAVAVRAQRPYTSEGATRETLRQLVSDPQQQRERLLSAPPARQLRALKASLPEPQLVISSVEPSTVEEERLHIAKAVGRSKKTYSEEVANSRKGARTFNF